MSDTPLKSKGLYETVQERSFGRGNLEARPLKLTTNPLKNALGSCLVECGDTHVLCAATIEERVDRWRKGSGLGWVTAEYSMLPASTARRTPRETRGQKGRTQEIQRLIGRSLRTAVNMKGLGGECTVTVDCDVLQADGGTRTASITGAWVALYLGMQEWVRRGRVKTNPVTGQVAAISLGIVDGRLLLDLDYPEDSHADVDMNVVMNADGEFVEIQGTGEQAPFSRSTLQQMLDCAATGVEGLLAAQREAVRGAEA